MPVQLKSIYDNDEGGDLRAQILPTSTQGSRCQKASSISDTMCQISVLFLCIDRIHVANLAALRVAQQARQAFEVKCSAIATYGSNSTYVDIDRQRGAKETVYDGLGSISPDRRRRRRVRFAFKSDGSRSRGAVRFVARSGHFERLALIESASDSRAAYRFSVDRLRASSRHSSEPDRRSLRWWAWRARLQSVGTQERCRLSWPIARYLSIRTRTSRA